MEIVIIICLFIIIGLMLKDKLRIGGSVNQQDEQIKVNPDLPDIMGQPRETKDFSTRKIAMKDVAETDTKTTPSLAADRENPDKKKEIDNPAITENNDINLEVEEESWGAPGIISDDGFATGVTFDELATVEKLLTQQTIKDSEKATVSAIASKIDGTELVGLLESRINDFSKRIAMLLDNGFDPMDGKGPTKRRNSDEGNFDIENFL
ncbi:MAG: conjugal transfer protein TraD [Flavobacterium psychrophilum]|nr:MAG: conjugal transfer protein TraD [Flavobacterium psychrophilum]